MRVAIVGAGAVGGYYGAWLRRAGHDVVVIARGAHLEALVRDGLTIHSREASFTVAVEAHASADGLAPADLVILAVKCYDNHSALPVVKALTGRETTVLTLQNGVDSADEVATWVGEPHVIAGAAYIATAIEAPGIVRQTGTHHRIVAGEIFRDDRHVSARVVRLAETFGAAGLQFEPQRQARRALWEKFIYLAPFAGLTGTARQPIGNLRAHAETRALLERAFAEVAQVGRAEGVAVAPDLVARTMAYIDALPPDTRSSLLIDLERGRRTEVEALQGAVVRRARQHGLDVPVMATFYALLRDQPAPRA